ncbi:DUF5615 family PIN-like protein [soil metagenome]
MPIGIYMDVHIPRAITLGLRARHVDVITAQDDGTATSTDPALLNRAMALGMMLDTFDDDLLIEANRRDKNGEKFTGVIFSRLTDSPVGKCIEDLELIAKTLDRADLINRIEYIPF